MLFLVKNKVPTNRQKSFFPLKNDSKHSTGKITGKTIEFQSWQGMIIAGIIFLLWGISLFLLLTANIDHWKRWMTVLAIAWQTFLYTGLFITAHDAMHGSVFPLNIKINHAIGTISALFYGLFSYQELLKKHGLHHQYPATEHDPDFHDGKNANVLSWYLYFMGNYWNWGRIIALICVFHSLHYFGEIPESNLTLFWVLPPIFSSLQLFYFGTFLTHRQPKQGYSNPHRAENTTFPTLLSFITCYHFGYHQEHHEYPHLPWWKLPEIHQLNKQNSV